MLFFFLHKLCLCRSGSDDPSAISQTANLPSNNHHHSNSHLPHNSQQNQLQSHQSHHPVGGSPAITFWYRLNRLIIRLCSTHQFKNLQVNSLYSIYIYALNTTHDGKHIFVNWWWMIYFLNIFFRVTRSIWMFERRWLSYLRILQIDDFPNDYDGAMMLMGFI